MLLVRTCAVPCVGVKVVVTRTRSDLWPRAVSAALVKLQRMIVVVEANTVLVAVHTRMELLPVLRALWMTFPEPGTRTRERIAVSPPGLIKNTVNAGAEATGATPEVVVTLVVTLMVTLWVTMGVTLGVTMGITMGVTMGAATLQVLATLLLA